ncbi:hypothetical protein U9M48_009138 [Paspalum notatum var. saurae]|uniref:Secreted protein n=1 Tax=Paspalum notatum var. saurae TaxID=547442 RepID=A0AAQ3SQC0_PASNO
MSYRCWLQVFPPFWWMLVLIIEGGSGVLEFHLGQKGSAAVNALVLLFSAEEEPRLQQPNRSGACRGGPRSIQGYSEYPLF